MGWNQSSMSLSYILMNVSGGSYLKYLSHREFCISWVMQSSLYQKKKIVVRGVYLKLRIWNQSSYDTFISYIYADILMSSLWNIDQTKIAKTHKQSMKGNIILEKDCQYKFLFKYLMQVTSWNNNFYLIPKM